METMNIPAESILLSRECMAPGCSQYATCAWGYAGSGICYACDAHDPLRDPQWAAQRAAGTLMPGFWYRDLRRVHAMPHTTTRLAAMPGTEHR